MSASVVGRDAELAALAEFLAGIPEGASALVLEGEAGVGKTTLWNAALALAEKAGVLVLRARPSESEAALSFSGLGDLLDPVLARALEPLADPQRRALARALMLEEGGETSPDSRAVGLAVLNGLRAIGSEQPVVVAVDDAQWLDAASAAALAYAARRLEDESVGLLVARRSGLDSTLADELRLLRDEKVVEVTVGPLDVVALRGAIRDQLGTTLPRPLLAEVHAAAGGNPFYALEIVRLLKRSGASVEAGHPLPVPESLHELVQGRLLALPSESRDFLLAAAAHAHPTLSITEAASGVPGGSGLLPAREAGVVVLEGQRIRFTHPLLAAGAYELADPLRRREIHRRLAEVLDDPEARAWQLAAATDEPDETVAAQLEEAARYSQARGAPRPAALLLDRACELTPPSRRDDAQRRAVDAAYLHFESGDSPRAEGQLRAVISELGPGVERARALVRLARVRSYRDQSEATELFLRAIDEAGEHKETLALAHEGVSTCLFRMRERLNEAVDHAGLAARLALDLGDHALAAEALGSKLLSEALLGRQEAAETVDQALALQPDADGRRVLAQPQWMAGVYWWWSDALERARDTNRSALERADQLGDESSAPYILILLGFVELTMGEYAAALAAALEGQQLAQQSGQPMPLAYNLAVESLVHAERGASEEARARAERALALVPETAGRPAELAATWALGHLELARERPGEAASALGPIVEFVRREAFGEPGAMRFVVDQIEALIVLGRHEEATELLDWYESHAGRLERISALASCLRCRGLLAAATGATDDALVSFGAALDLHAKVEIPLDRGRTLLALGSAQRRAKRRREARGTLEQARALFAELGAEMWARRAREEARRISGRAASAGALTPAEERVAALVAEGKTNREVAAALFLSERTVEGHLSRIFGKLGVRHRAEIASVLARTQTQGSPPPNTSGGPVSAERSAP